MPLVARNALPTYARMAGEGQLVLSPARAEHQYMRGLHVGLLNMMPDAALEATERQFFRLVGSSNPISQFWMHPFTLDKLPRSAAARAHIDQHYESWDEVKANGLDALIISGINVTKPNLADELFWEPLQEVLAWADENVASTLCSCLATHAVMQGRYGMPRRQLADKAWGVFAHEVTERSHPLVRRGNTHMLVPHSRFNEVSEAQFLEAGARVLVRGEVGVQVAVSPDGFRTVMFQGHPEYDPISLMKEYKREVGRYINGDLDQWPPVPANYFDTHSLTLLEEYRHKLEAAMSAGERLPAFPENYIAERLHNTWLDSARSLFGTWLGLVYQLTHRDVHKQYMDEVDRDDPLGLLRG